MTIRLKDHNQPRKRSAHSVKTGLITCELSGGGVVTIQHALTLTWTEDELSAWKPLDTGIIGQSGVGLFCLISGWLAIQDKRSPIPWIIQRLRVLLPGYWIVLVISFALAVIVKRESVSASQVLSQFLCIGLWTHPKTLVNEPTWFVNFIVLCYVVVAVLKMLPRINLAVFFSLLCTLCFVSIALTMDLSIWPWYHLISFLMGILLAIHFRKPPSVILVAIALGFLGLSIFQSVFVNISLSMLIASIPLEHLRIAGSKWISDHTYAYFLVHGIFLSGMVFWMPSTPVVAIPLAILIACMAAVCLQWMVVQFLNPNSNRKWIDA